MDNKKLVLECNIPASDVTLGGGRKNSNKIVVRVVNATDETVEFGGLGEQGTLSLTISVGTEAKDLVANAEDSAGIKVVSSANWEQEDYKNLAGQVTWSFRLPNEVLKARQDTSLTLTNFESNTDPGKAQLTVQVAITGYDNFANTLDVAKKVTETLQILYFRADPPQIITDTDRSNFVLEWNTIRAGQVHLYRANNVFHKEVEGQNGFQNGKKFSYAEEQPSLTTVYKLVASDPVDSTITQEKEVTVRVLQPGWYKLNDFRRRFGYPSVLCNMNRVKLYGIFVNRGQASLCSSAYPVAVWELEKSVVPAKMATSPAVSFANQLWLVGGSTADSKNFSNQVWTYTPGGGEWAKKSNAAWSPRMGHACVVMQNRLWVLGGMDANGNPLKDVWSCDTNGAWTSHPAAAWPARCMQAATFFQDRLWIYGGVTEPFGDPLEDMWTSRDGKTWENYAAIPQDDAKPIGKPIGCALQVVNGELNLLGTFRKSTITEPRRFILEEAQQTWRGSKIPDETAWHQQGGNTFSLSSAEFKGLVFLRSLNYETTDNPTSLNVYVP